MKRLLLSLLLLACTVVGQEQLFEIRDFKGLNTVAGDFAVQPNEARLAHNIDFGRNVGSITKRYGYDSISTISGMDSIVAIYGAYYSDGTQQLFVVADLADSGYGKVYVTNKGSVNLDSATAICDYWSILGCPSFSMVDDNIYIVNGYNRGIVYSNGVARSFPAKAPSEPTIVPLSDSGGLDGEYYYIISAKEDTSTDGNPFNFPYGDVLYQGVISDKIRVSNGKVLLTHFSLPNTDSVETIWDTTGAGTGVTFVISRSKANQGRITPDMKFYNVFNFYARNAEDAYNYIYEDSKTDSAISYYDPLPGRYSDDKFDIEKVGRDSLGGLEYRYGAPGFLIQDTIGGSGSVYHYSDTTDTTSAYGIFHGIIDQRDTLGFAYTCTFIDTVTGIESDTGRSLFIWLDTAMRSGDKPFYNSMTLPKIPYSDSGIVINLYRSLIKQVTYDTAYWVLRDMSNLDLTQRKELLQWYVQQFGNSRIRPVGVTGLEYWKEGLSVDTVVTNEYYLLGQFSVSDTIFTDSLRQDSVKTKRLYTKSTPPDILSQIMSYQGRLFGVERSRLWRSGLLDVLIDTLQTWGQMDFQSLNASDGDIGTVAFPTRTAIRFMKNFSSFNVYDDFSKTEISNTIGCIAPRSYASGAGGHYYLSKAGVIYETDGQQLERTFNTNLVSQKIKNFDSYDITELADAYGAYFDRKYMLTISDTTYVFDERSGEWATWSLPISSATKYGTESNVTFIPGDTLYFIKPGGSTIYRYGTSEYDNYRAGVDSTNIQWLWKSPPLFTDFREVSINSIGMWCNSATTGDSIGVQIIDEEGVTAGYTWYKNLSQRYFKNGVFTDKGKYFTLKLGTASNAVDIGSTYIDGLDVFYKIIGNTQIE